MAPNHSYTTKLKLNNRQKTLMAKHAGFSRWVYNWGLGMWKDAYNEGLKPNIKTLKRLFTNHVKPEYPWMRELSSKVYQYAFINLGEAFKRFFKGWGKYPRFKCKGKNDRFTIDNSGRPIRLGGLIHNLPFLKQVRTFEPLPDCLTKKVTIYKKAGEWYISFSMEKTFEPTLKERERVGVDFGIKTLAVLSSGVEFEGLKPYRNAQRKLSRVQRKLSKKERGSQNYLKTQLEVQKFHHRVANLRKDYLQVRPVANLIRQRKAHLYKMTTYIAKNHGEVVIEDLNVSGMMANHKLAKAIGDLGLHEARRQLTYKCERYGTKLVVADRFFPSSQLCSNCGNQQPMPLSQRVYSCDCCGNKIDRDWNASVNLERYNEYGSTRKPVEG
ncbi:transposase [Moorena producens PAL-8-15-08-1]|uniref:Transposase n=1 Tax=Moorena producens PAL-8-15-08-1 TaxID=1458985 RepID=A0A1D8TS40_9CYAN|nr:RNA-guided endonuclease TnpB family protein [Moorena producens]AOX00404.1 transposase [Moorena producens PAL-8-15-08-1]